MADAAETVEKVDELMITYPGEKNPENMKKIWLAEGIIATPVGKGYTSTYILSDGKSKVRDFFTDDQMKRFRGFGNKIEPNWVEN